MVLVLEPRKTLNLRQYRIAWVIAHPDGASLVQPVLIRKPPLWLWYFRGGDPNGGMAVLHASTEGSFRRRSNAASTLAAEIALPWPMNNAFGDNWQPRGVMRFARVL